MPHLFVRKAEVGDDVILLYCYCLRLFGQKKNSKEQFKRTENRARSGRGDIPLSGLC